jgi:hypothetical protein
MDGGVGGSWEERELEPATIKIEGQELPIQQSLPQSNQKPLDLQ